MPGFKIKMEGCVRPNSLFKGIYDIDEVSIQIMENEALLWQLPVHISTIKTFAYQPCRLLLSYDQLLQFEK